MNAPIAQSHNGTSQIPHARLSALQGTTPINRKIVSLTHMGVGADAPLDFFVNIPCPSSSSSESTGDSSGLEAGEVSNADRVRDSALGNIREMTGVSGLLRRVLQRLPIVVRKV